MNRWIEQCQAALQRLGVVGALGLAMLGGAAWLQMAWLPAQQRAADELGSQARGLRHDLLVEAEAGQANPGQPVVDRPELAWERLWTGLPTVERKVPLQAMVLQAAKARGLQVQAVQFQGQREAWAHQAHDTLWRQRMVMPVQGPYPAVKAWLQALLQEPALSLDTLAIQRDSVNSDQVVAQLSLSLWWRQPDGGAR
mgnify:CR=1 FL=1